MFYCFLAQSASNTCQTPTFLSKHRDVDSHRTSIIRGKMTDMADSDRTKITDVVFCARTHNDFTRPPTVKLILSE